MEIGPPPLFGLESDYQGPINLGAGLPPLGPPGCGPPLQSFPSEQLAPLGSGPPPLMPPSMPLGMPPGMPPGFDGALQGLGVAAEMPAGLPPGFPPLDLPPGLPPGFPPGFVPPAADPAFCPSGPPSSIPLGGLGTPVFSAVNGGAIGPPPSEPPPATAGTAGSTAPAASDAERKRKRSGVDGLASNKHIKSGGTVTVYNGYGALTNTHAPAPKAASASAFSASMPALSKIQGQEGLTRSLPEGWEMKKSRSSGKTYYVNEKLGKSQFDPPAGSSVKVAPQKKKDKASTRPKDTESATMTSSNGVKGVVRATDKNMARWQKWQKCSRVVNAESPERDG